MSKEAKVLEIARQQGLSPDEARHVFGPIDWAYAVHKISLDAWRHAVRIWVKRNRQP